MNNRLAGLILFCAAITAAHAADHREAPAVLADPAADINDVYAFVNPNDPGEFIVAATVHPRATANTRFSDAVTYRFYIENGAGQTFEYACSFSGSAQVECVGSNGAAAAGRTESIVTGSDLRIFAGLREDPFYLDGAALAATLEAGEAQFTDPGTDTFAGFNTLALVLGIPISTITDGSEEANLTFFWAATDRLASSVGINGSVSGPWVILDESGAVEAGQGFQFEVLLSPADPVNPRQFFVTFYGNLNGEQLWLAGNSPNISGTSITVPVARFEGAQFVPDFSTGDLMSEVVGEVTISFADANTGTASFAPADGGALPAFSESIARLAVIEGLAPSLPAKAGQVDRMGRAAVAAALVPADIRDDYNANDDPSTWAESYTEAIATSLAFVDGLDGIEGNSLTGDTAFLASVIADDRLLTRVDIPDCVGGYLAIEAATVSGFEPSLCGGRTLDDDVSDLTLTLLVSGGSIAISDNVDANDVDSTLDVFPFLGEPQ